ncbi:hypothetical protein Bca52824_005369 [Brassica carinata]|uniref:Uncharacterized protein n=1 Tax=Brassica carinata TaxID=52824 RepID=A0A8X7WQM1_BRACI|nr:hypothetical protein Bca52824_005369 [Brassica carinata]
MSKEGQTVIGDGIVTPNAIYGDPLGALIHQTIYRDTPAPFRCLYCGITGLTTIRLLTVMNPPQWKQPSFALPA